MSDTAPNSKSSNWLSTLYYRMIKPTPNQAGTQGTTQLKTVQAPILGSVANPLMLSDSYWGVDAAMKKAREENSQMVKNVTGIPATNEQPTNVDIHDANEGGDPSISSSSKVLSARQAAASMRERAMECVTIPGLGMRPEDIITHIKNAIGQLSDFSGE